MLAFCVLYSLPVGALTPVGLPDTRCHEPCGVELVAPFDAETAQHAQRDWSARLGIDVSQRNSLGMSMVLIPPGEFMMGSPESEISLLDEHQEDEVRHRVRLTRPFRIGAHMIRVGDFRAFVAATKYRTDAERDPRGGWGVVDGVFKRSQGFSWKCVGFEQHDDSPVVNVGWNDAAAFCRWLAKKEGMHYRLPTEAEWEYACRAGTESPYYFGDACNGTNANCDGNYPFGTKTKGPFLRRTCAVGSYKPNSFGLFDMSGNANEFCSDWYQKDYFAKSPIEDPKGPANGDTRVVRGGGWATGAASCRSADRGGVKPDFPNPDVGFRVVCDLPSADAPEPPKK